MVKVSYKECNADYIRVKFKCKCGEEITTDMIPVKERYDLGKDVNIFTHDKNIICPMCKEEYIFNFYDDMYHSYCEIPSLADDNDIIYLHEIPYEYAQGYDNAFIDYIEEIVKLKELVAELSKQNTIGGELFLRMTFSYALSIMDAFLHNTFINNVERYDLFKREFLANSNRKNKKINAKEQIKVLKGRSFQNLEMICIPYYKDAFGIEINKDDVIQNAVQKRNAIIHNNSRERDGYLYEVSESDIIELITHIESLVKDVYFKIQECVFDKIILPNIESCVKNIANKEES